MSCVIGSKGVRYNKEKFLKDPKAKEKYEKYKPIWDLKYKLIEARVKAGMTQKDVAEAMNCCPASIGRFETTSDVVPTFRSVINYAKAVGLKEIRIKLDQ